MLTTLIYFPITRLLYYLDEQKKPFVCKYSDDLMGENKTALQTSQGRKERIVYTNNRVADEVISALRRKNYTVIEDDGKVLWPEALLKCISGEFAAAVFHSPQIRDVLLGALIESLPNGYMTDWNGNRIPWPQGGRIARVIFGFGDILQLF